MKKTQLKYGDVAIEMVYNQKSRTKKLLLFLIVSVIVCAMAFSACYFALEISRTNKYNTTLNNSITQNTTENENTPSTIPNTGNSQTGSGSSTNKVELAIDAPTGYELTIQTVWGITNDSSNFNKNDLYSLEMGIRHARNMASCFYIGVDDTGVSEPEHVSVWRGSDAEYNSNSPTYSESQGNITKSIGWNNPEGNHTIGLKEWDGETAQKASEWFIKMEAVGMSALTATNYVITLGYLEDDGDFATIYSKVIDKGVDEVSITEYDNGNRIYLNDYFDKKHLYAVITKPISVKVNDTGTYRVSTYVSASKTGIPRLLINEETGLTIKSVNILNCIAGAENVLTRINFLQGYTDGAFGLNSGGIFSGVMNEFSIVSKPTWVTQTITSGFIWIVIAPEANQSPYIYDTNVENVCPFSFENVLKYSKEEITLKYDPTNVTINNGGTKNTYYCTELNHMNQSLSKLKTNGSALIDGYDYDVSYDGGDSSKTITINGLAYGSYKNLASITIDNSGGSLVGVTNCKTVNIEDGGVNILGGTVEVVNNNYSGPVQICEGATVKKVNLKLQYSRVKFLGANDSTTQTLINIYNDPSKTYGSIPVITAGNHNFKVNILESLNGDANRDEVVDQNDKYYIVQSEKTGYETPKGDNNGITGAKISYTNGLIKEIGEEYENSKFVTYIRIDINIIPITSYDGEINSFVWMLNQERANGSLTGYYLLKNDIVIPDGIDSDGNGTLDYYFQGFGNARITSGAGPFKGTFDGGGYKVTIGWNNMGLFNTVGDGAVIKNLVLDGTVTKGYGDGNQHLVNGSPKYDAAGNPVWDYYRFYGLAMQTRGNVSIINVYNNLEISSYTYADGNKIEYSGSETTFVGLNYGTLNFVNCVASYFPVDNDGSGYVKSSFVGANWTDATLKFINCVAKTCNFIPKNSNNKVGAFLGWDKNTSIKTSFTNCYKLVIPGVTGSVSDYIPIIGGVGSGDMPTSAVLDSSLANVNKEYTVLSEVDTYLNEYIDNNGFYSNGTISQTLYYWDENYIRVWDSIADATVLKNLCNGTDMSYRSAHITGDITVNDWTGFETFLGLLDGLGNTITFGANCSQGLIKNNGGTVKNLNTAGTITTSSNYVGAIAGTNTAGEESNIQSGVISKCTNNATITGHSTYSSYIGGIAGAGKDIYSCINNGNVTGNKFVGGIVGIQEDYYQIESCENTGKIIGKVNVGGIAGSAYYIWSCTNEGNIKCTYTGRTSNIGGLVGALFESNSRYGNHISGTSAGTIEVTGKSSSFNIINIGGVVGYIGSGDYNVSGLNNCTVTVKIQATYCSWIGGIVGYSLKPISNAIFNGTINAINSSYIGGICGSSDGDITNCKVFVKNNLEPSITATNSTYIAGISGYSSGNITKCIVGDNSTDIYNKVIVADANCNLVAGICVGYGASKTITNCYVYGSIESNASNTSGITYLYSVENCVFNGNIIVNNVDSIPEGLTLISNSGNVTSVVFNGYVCDANNNKAPLHSGTTEGVKITTKTATRCFVLSDETTILFTPQNADGSIISGVSYTGCSTFKDIQNSLVYNGVFFGHLADALSGLETTYWKIQLNNLIYDENTLNNRQTTLTILDMDNLNSINNCVLNTSYEFTESFIFNEGFILEDFAGLGFDNKPIIMHETSLGFTTDDETIVNIYLNNACVFNNIKNAKINNIATHLKEGGATQYTLINKATDCTISNCINYVNIVSNKAVGGIAYSCTNGTINNCKNYGNITLTDGLFSGGIVAVITGTIVKNCYSNSIVTVKKMHYGGIVGQANGGTISNCITDGIMSMQNDGSNVCFAGILASATGGTVNINNCVSFVNVISCSSSSGITYLYAGKDKTVLNINNCYFFGDIYLGNIISGKMSGGSYFEQSSVNYKNCGYNINNKEFPNNNGATLIYVKDTNPVWSASAYIKLLFKTETESMFNGTNTKLKLNWYDTDASTADVQSGYDTTFWQTVLNCSE